MDDNSTRSTKVQKSETEPCYKEIKEEEAEGCPYCDKNNCEEE